MKKLSLLVSVAVLAISFTSCKKTRYCNCTVDSDKVAIEYKDISKKDMKAACDGWNTLAGMEGGSCKVSSSSDGEVVDPTDI